MVSEIVRVRLYCVRVCKQFWNEFCAYVSLLVQSISVAARMSHMSHVTANSILQLFAKKLAHVKIT